MIPIKNVEWHGYWNGVDLRMTIDLQLWSKRLGTLKEMRRENTPCLLKSYFTKTIIHLVLMASESIAHSAASWAIDSEPIRDRGNRGIIVKYEALSYP